MSNLLYAAMTAANLHFAAQLEAIAVAAVVDRPALVAAATARHRDEMAALGCSALPPCGLGLPGDALRCQVRAFKNGRIAPSGAAVDLSGSRWIAQSADAVGKENAHAIVLDDDGTIRFSAKAGERPWFDPPQKIRAEFCGLQRFGKGEPIAMRFAFQVDPATKLDELDWSIIAQIHQADMHYADGDFVEASPIFSLNLKEARGGDVLQVGGETARSPMREPLLDPLTGRQASGASGALWRKHFAPLRLLTRSAVLARGVWHTVEFRVIDGHGEPGSITVKVDGIAVVDRPSIPTGYSYVDDLAQVPYAGGLQDTGSYLKFGLYGGRFQAGAPPPSGPVFLRFKDVAVLP